MGHLLQLHLLVDIVVPGREVAGEDGCRAHDADSSESAGYSNSDAAFLTLHVVAAVAGMHDEGVPSVDVVAVVAEGVQCVGEERFDAGLAGEVGLVPHEVVEALSGSVVDEPHGVAQGGDGFVALVDWSLQVECELKMNHGCYRVELAQVGKMHFWRGEHGVVGCGSGGGGGGAEAEHDAQGEVRGDHCEGSLGLRRVDGGM